MYASRTIGIFETEGDEVEVEVDVEEDTGELAHHPPVIMISA